MQRGTDPPIVCMMMMLLGDHVYDDVDYVTPTQDSPGVLRGRRSA